MLILVFIFGLIWGSFLNVLATRLIAQESLGGRSKCPHCNHQIAWYDNVPIISWIILGGKCRTCAQPISVLYPFIELLTGVFFVLLYLKLSQTCPGYTSGTIRPEWINQICDAWQRVNPSESNDLLSVRPSLSAEALREGWKFRARIAPGVSKDLPSYFIFFSALIVTIRTDLEHMLISRAMTLFLVPVGIALSMVGFLPISPLESFLSAVGGYLFFFAVAKIFHRITGREGIGQGDFDLMALIGAFTGLLGLWMTILIGSVVGCIASIIYLLITQQDRSTHIPFGPFLALGAICYVLFGEWLVQFLSI